MQDKYNNKEMIDRGWAEMSKILDHEMPVVRNKRRLLWFWLVPMLVLMSIGVAYSIYALQNDDNGETPTQNEVYQPMAATQDRLTNDSDVLIPENQNTSVQDADAVASIESELSDLELNNEQRVVNSPVNMDVATPDIKTTNAEPGELAIENTQPMVQSRTNQQIKQTTPKSTLEEQPVRNSVVAAELDESESVEEVSKPSTNTSDRRIQTESVVLPIQSDLASSQRVIAQLPGIWTSIESQMDELAVVPLFAVERTSEPIKPIRSLSRCGVDIAFGLKGNMNGDAGLQGISLGPEIRVPLGERVGLYAAMQYEYQKKDGILNLNSNSDLEANIVTFSDISDNMKDLAGITADASYEQVEFLRNSSHYLHFPFGIEYRLSDRFSVHAGARYSRLLSAPSDFDIAVLDDMGQSLDLDADRFSSNALYTNNFVKKQDVAATFGASLYLGRHWAITAEYNHGFMALIKPEDPNGQNRFNRVISMGLRYSFSQCD